MHEVGDQHTFDRILSKNDELAEHNRQHFDELGIYAVNLMSAPGAGKTTLLEETIPRLGADACIVIEGDMVGELDAARLRQKKIEAHQISTGRSCHLDAQMVARLLHDVSFHAASQYVFLENVGNLVCPAEFALGEHARVVLLSVTEGADKPLKYPVIFRNCDAVIFTKCDLLPYVDFDLSAASEYVLNINPGTAIFNISTRTRSGLHQWLDWLRARRVRFLSSKQVQPGHGHVHLHTG